MFTTRISGGFADSPRETWHLEFNPMLMDWDDLGSHNGRFELSIINFEDEDKSLEKSEVGIAELSRDELIRLRDAINEYI